jgi:hypothetical protein
MKRKSVSLLLLLTVTALVLAGCSLFFPKNIPATGPQATLTRITLPNSATPVPQIAATVTMLAQTAAALAVPPTPPSQPNATATTAATVAPATAAPATAAPATFTPNTAACNAAAFLGDITIPDRSLIAQGTPFVKTWRVQNTGSCTWTTDYQLVFVSGYNMNGPRALRFSSPVAPGATVDISVNLTVPGGYGMYSATYELKDDKGNIFGFGPSGTDPLVVRILTPFTPTPTLFAVTSVTLSVDYSSATTACPPGHVFNFNASITTNNSGVVTYHWLFSDGTKTATQQLTYSSAGTQGVSAAVTLGNNGPLAAGNPYNGWAQIYIDAPNHQAFSQQAIQLNCSP